MLIFKTNVPTSDNVKNNILIIVKNTASVVIAGCPEKTAKIQTINKSIKKNFNDFIFPITRYRTVHQVILKKLMLKTVMIQKT
jgi:ABC-type arginine transport system permease subunit